LSASKARVEHNTSHGERETDGTYWFTYLFGETCMKHITYFLVFVVPLATAACNSDGLVFVVPCSMDQYQGYWELSGNDKGGHDLDGLMSIFPGVSGVQFQVRTRRAFGEDGQICFVNGARADCQSGAVVPEMMFWCVDTSDCCGSTISIIEDDAIATITFQSSSTARFRVESREGNSWSPISGTLWRTD